MPKTWSLGLAAAVVLFVGNASGSAAFSKQTVSIPMDDGVSMSGTLYLPDGATPAGGWPAVMLLHGIGGSKQDMNTLIEGSGVAGLGYVLLTVDARGHGQSGGLVSVAGPREIADTRAAHAWLAARPDVADAKIGAFGYSLGGGAAFNSLVAGVPWGAVVTVQTWTDFYTALMPQGLVKSGLVAGLAGSVPEAKRDPSLAPLTLAAFAGNVAAVRPWTTERSSLAKLGSITTPVFMAQGRRDFLFGIDQGTLAFKRLRGPKALYLGLHGHAPSTFPAADTGYLLSQVRAFYDCYLGATPCARPATAFALAPEGFTGGPLTWAASQPGTTRTTVAFPGVTTFARTGKLVRRSAPLRSAIEVYGSPTVTARVAVSGGWSRLVAVLTARTPQGKEIVVSAGGTPTKQGVQKVTVRLVSQATFVPRGSRLTLTLGSSSLAQSPSNLLYLDLPMPPTARVRVGNAVLALPGLRKQVTK